MKLANVNHCLNLGNRSYLTITVLCVLSKVFERVMYSSLSNFLERFIILIQNQFGFRKCHWSYMALMAIMDNIIQALEKGEFVVGVFLDFSKAFDTVNHDILFEKKCIIMESEVLSYIGSKAICTKENSMSHIMINPQLLRLLNVGSPGINSGPSSFSEIY